MRVKYEEEATDDELKVLKDRMTGTTPTIDKNGGYSWPIKCPHCDFAMTVALPRAVVDSVTFAQPRALCQCTEEHEGRPKDVTVGCGFDAMAPVTIGATGP